MKQLIATLVLLIALCSAAYAENANTTWLEFPKVEVSTQYLSKYVTTGGTDLSEGKPVIWTDALFTFEKSGLWLYLWSSIGPDEMCNWKDNYSNEVDAAVGWSGNICGLDVTASITWFGNSDIRKWNDDQILLHADVGKSFSLDPDGVHTLTPYLGISGYFPTDSTGPENGMYLTAGLKYNLKLTETLSLHSFLELLKDDGAMGNDNGFIGKGGTTLSWQFYSSETMNVALEGGVNFWKPLTVNDSRRFQAVWFGGLRCNL